MRIITIAAQRGGTGKTTTAAALAQAAAFRGLKVLAVDLDPQGNFTFALGVSAQPPGILEVLHGRTWHTATKETADGIHVLTASQSLAAEQTAPGSANRLRNALKAARTHYDMIIIDTPPTAGEMQYNALQAATDLIIPLQADIFGLQGLYMITATARQIQQTNKDLQIAGVIFTRHNPRSTITRQMQQAITAKAAEMDIPVLGAIREGVAIREAQALQQSLYEYAPKAKPAADYLEILDEIRKGRGGVPT